VAEEEAAAPPPPPEPEPEPALEPEPVPEPAPEPALDLQLDDRVAGLELEEPLPPAALAVDLPEEPAPAAAPPAEQPVEVPPEPVPAPDVAALGRAHLEAQEWELAYLELSEALELSPGDAGLQRDLMRAAEKLGNFERYVELGELSIDALAAEDRLGAAARLRQLAEILRVRLGQPERAATLLERALALVPGDPDTRRELAATLALRPRNAPRALEGWLSIARHDPSDAGALSALSSLCARTAETAEPLLAARLAELGRLAASMASFASPGAPRPPAARLASRLSPEVRAEIACPPGSGPSARLLSLLAPWLEPLFPADLSRRGASTADWLAPPRAPGLRAAIESASRALSSRPYAAFLTRRPGIEVAVENTQPPAMIFSGGVIDLNEGAVRFLAARTLDQVQHGWALGGRFAPRDVGILLELACRFAGGTAPSLGLPAERAGSFLAALARSVPAGVVERARTLASDAARELSGLEPRAFADGMRRTANRVALLYGGDPAEAFRALAALERAGDPSALEPVQVLAIPDVADLAQFALSERYLALRLAVLG
jgi:tetratricopeptide (TPR) repeat protein